MPFDWMRSDGKIILVEKAVRTIPYGFLGVLFSVYLSQLGFGVLTIGIVLTLTTASSTAYTLIATILGDRLGRRRILMFFSLTSTSPSLSGYLMQTVWLGTPFLIAGALKTIYDIAIYRTFRKTKVLDEGSK
jgi:MFS family permease